MTTTTTTIAEAPPLTHEEAMDLQEAELQRTIELLESLDDHEWSAPTDCPAWDVRQMYLHVLGACDAGASMRENMHQLRAARKHRKRNGGPLEAALSAVQVRERETLSTQELVDRMRTIAPKTIRGRKRTPGLMRKRAKFAVDGPVHETWTLGYLIDTILLRDMWMHRVDTARATGRRLELTPEHDGRIVADVVAEWARRHGRPFALQLEGPAGGTFAHGPDSPDAVQLTMDAVEFCRILSGRGKGTGLLATVVPF